MYPLRPQILSRRPRKPPCPCLQANESLLPAESGSKPPHHSASVTFRNARKACQPAAVPPRRRVTTAILRQMQRVCSNHSIRPFALSLLVEDEPCCWVPAGAACSVCLFLAFPANRQAETLAGSGSWLKARRGRFAGLGLRWSYE